MVETPEIRENDSILMELTPEKTKDESMVQKNDKCNDSQAETSTGEDKVKCEEENEQDENKEPPIKSIMKHGPLLTEKHVDFNTDKVELIPFDETKDYTIEIQIVEKITPKIVSYRELFAQMKAAEAAKAAEEQS